MPKYFHTQPIIVIVLFIGWFLLSFQFKKGQPGLFSVRNETTTKNCGWHLVWSICFLVTGRSNEKNKITFFSQLTFTKRRIWNSIVRTVEVALQWFVYFCFSPDNVSLMVIGQLISEWLFDILNFLSNQRKNLMTFCPRL